MKRFFTLLCLAFAATFISCGEDPAEETNNDGQPQLTITSSTTLSIAAEEETYQITYTLTNPKDDEDPEGASSAGWIDSFDNTDAGVITFLAQANTGSERTATITVTYPGVEPLQVTVTQAAAGTQPEKPSKEVMLTDDIDGLPKTYTKGTTNKLGDHSYLLNEVANYGNGIQFRKGSGYLANIDNMGVISSIELTFSATSPSTDMTLCLGDSPTPSGDGIKAARVGDVYRFDCSAESCNYFTLSSGGGANFLKSIKIKCGGSGGVTPPGPDPVDEPMFEIPSYSALAMNSVTISCTYSYTGKGTVSEAYFLYGASNGSEERIALANAQPGAKSASLTRLTIATLYSYRLCVVIDDKTYSSATGSFVTYDETGKPSINTRYSGWAELLSENSSKLNNEYFYAYHLCPDYPSSGVKARNFSTCYSKSLRCPVWVAAPLHDCYTGGVDRTNNYRTDPAIKCTQAGKWAGYTRGHMLGSNERRVTTNVNRDVFYYSNIAPQSGTYFNAGGGQWNTAEDWVDKQWRTLADTLYQVVGTYWEDNSKVVAGTTIPTHYYTVLLKVKKSAGKKWAVNCTRDELQTIAIMVKHKAYAKTEVIKPADYLSKGVFKSVAEVERLTGHTFFPNVPNAPKTTFDVKDWNF